jgi:hypothetical protein
MKAIMAYFWLLSQHFLWSTMGSHKNLGWSRELISRGKFFSGPHEYKAALLPT